MLDIEKRKQLRDQFLNNQDDKSDGYKMGDTTECYCGNPIKFNGDTWSHQGQNYRHIPIPKEFKGE